MKQFFNNFVGNPNDILSGITVALARVPEAVAFAFVAGIDPLVGLYVAFMMGLITSLLEGVRDVSGATGAMAVLMVHLIQNEVGNAIQLENLGDLALYHPTHCRMYSNTCGSFPFGKIRSSYPTQ